MKIVFTIIFFFAVVSAAQPRLMDSVDWKRVGGRGTRSLDPATGEPILVVSSDNVKDAPYWRLDYPFLPGRLYELSVKFRAEPGASITAVNIGTDFFNRDLKAGNDWRREKILFVVPQNSKKHYIRLGMWRGVGTVWFSEIVVRPATAGVSDPRQPGQGESVNSDVYQAYFYFAQSGSNYAACLADFDAAFNTNRWDLYGGDYVIYRHDVSFLQTMQLHASVSLNVNYRWHGRIVVQASRDGKKWLPLGKCPKVGRYEFTVPRELFPAASIYVRFKAVGLAARLQVNEYRYKARLSKSFPAMQGSSLFVKGLAEQDELDVTSLHLEDGVLTASVQSRGKKKKKIRIVAESSTAKKSKSIKLEPGLATKAVLTLPDNAGAAQNVGIYEAGNDRPIAVIELAEKPYLDWDDYGSLLKTGDDAVFWWTDGVRKIGKHRRPPTRPASKKIELWCARNEYEPVQLVVSPKRDMRLDIRAGDLRHKSGRVLKSALSLFAVEYVDVQTPTDGVGAAAPWPDPLPPIDGPMLLKKNENQPLWILAYIPDDAPAGDYEGWIEATVDGKSRRFPIVVHVWDFTLPKQTHLQTAFGFYSSFIPRYHHFSDADRLDEILEKYFQSFASHRISPYDPFVLSPIEVEFDMKALTARLDFTKFDRAYQHYINELGFNTFRLPIKGLGYGSFHGATRGKIGPYEQGSPQYEKIMTSYLRQLETHLQKLGALDKAYIYWFDEPEPKDYPFVRETMQLLQRAAPKLTRMLTEQPEPELFGAVDLWCPISHRFQEDVARQRRRRGERFWWYICTNPKAPYPTLFIDHYAVELRTWIWQTWKYDIDGILVWSANYWTSANVFPWPNFQNPWADPMSYRSGGSLKEGEITYWGNGDGRFIYPPKQVFESTEKCDLGPVSSIRWEMLREGLEDYEYLWLLRSLVERLRKRGGHARLLRQAEELLVVPESITRTPTEFSKKPEPIFEHRQKAAEMIVKLQRVL